MANRTIVSIEPSFEEDSWQMRLLKAPLEIPDARKPERFAGNPEGFLVWDGDKNIRAMSATCTHLGCQVQWDAKGKKFRCPCHGGVYAADGTVLEGPPPRPLQTIDARIESDSSVLVRL